MTNALFHLLWQDAEYREAYNRCEPMFRQWARIVSEREKRRRHRWVCL